MKENLFNKKYSIETPITFYTVLWKIIYDFVDLNIIDEEN